MEFSGGFSMSREYYYTTIASWGNYATDEEPIVVNCADFTDKVRNGTTKVSKGRLDYSVCFLSEGNMFFAIGDGEEQEIGGGTVVIVPPKTPMRYGQREQAVRRCYWVHFTGSHAASLVEQCGFENGGIFRLPDERGAAAAFNELLDEMKNPPTPRSRLRAAAATVMLLTHLGLATTTLGLRFDRLGFRLFDGVGSFSFFFFIFNGLLCFYGCCFNLCHARSATPTGFLGRHLIRRSLRRLFGC